MNTFYARPNKQLLGDHLYNVAELSAEFSICKNISKLSGLLHDIGKASFRFQDYIMNGGKRGSVIHSMQGAFLVDEITSNPADVADILLKEIVAQVVEAHHNHLKDGVSPDGEKLFYDRLKSKEDEKYSYQEVKQNIEETLSQLQKDIDDIISLAKEDIVNILTIIWEEYNQPESAQFVLGLLVKHLYSCLIDADRLEAYLSDIEEQYDPITPDWEGFINTFEDSLLNFSSQKNKMSTIRQEISRKCKEAATVGEGIYQLSVPTGGGKTLSSMRFALHHCRAKGKKRIIYVIPYLSIIDQTASELRKILNLSDDSEIILEHHSNVVPLDGEDENTREARKLAAKRWDKPIIITTMVQFLETVMSSRASALRKLHSMSDAVIVFDEIQSIPIKSIHLFNETVSFLAKVCNSTILLCTATQPRLDKTERENLLIEQNPNLIDCSEMFDGIKRTAVVAEKEKNIEEFSAFILEKSIENGNCLAIVNTKKSAREIYEKLNDESCYEIYHLSTSMCGAHRSVVIAKVREALEKKRKVICVTTQLIEAGVDISFSCVVRATAGLDSIVQAAGRCNRNGESVEPKKVYAVPLLGENLDKLEDIKIGKEITERLIYENQNTDLMDPEILNKFYEYYFYNRRNIMDYRVNNDTTVYDMLSLNEIGKGNYKNTKGVDCSCFIVQAFNSADKEYCVIDRNTTSIVVYYSEAEELLDVLSKQPKNIITREKLDVLRKLEKFTVSLFSWEMDKLEGAIHVIDEEFEIRTLDKAHYSSKLGVTLEADPMEYIC
ncbi:MAG: CRISPR-associated helicase Cas3' [Oscillospiraceae bacterium]|nr:CRISPR-associated helicase Cas3' [Oscillospiraceae bacterium]